LQHAAIARPKPLIGAHLLLLLAERPRHGYELAGSLRMWEFEGVTASTVYRELARLEEDGLVGSFWAASQARGPARHMYELTAAGRDELAFCADDIGRLISHLTDFLSRCSSVDLPGTVAPAAGPAEPHPGTAQRRRWTRR
jgi:DNA-binding PadR family transcriptional regulator